MIDIPRVAASRFHAVVTRNAEALRRSGEAFYQCNEFAESQPKSDKGRLFEVLFADGMWMLASAPDPFVR